MIVRLSFGILLIFILFIHTLNAMNPAYLKQHRQEPELASLVEAIKKSVNDQYSDFDSSEKMENNDDDYNDEQLIKRSKYPNFHISPLWLSRRTRTNRFYGKPLWISRTG